MKTQNAQQQNGITTTKWDHKIVSRLKSYQIENIDEAIEAFTDFDFRKPAVFHYGGLTFGYSDFENITDSQERLYNFLDMVQAGMNNAQRTVIVRECKECHKPFRTFSNSKMEFCSYQCAEAYQFMLELDEHYNEKQKKQRS